MKQNAIINLLAAIAAFTMFTSCRDYEETTEQEVVMEGTIVLVDEYGGLQPSFGPDNLKAAGVEFGDLLTLCIGNDIEVTAPYVDAYTESGSMSPCLCNYNKGDNVTVSMSNGSFANHVGCKAGDKFVVKMQKKKGYLNEYKLLGGTYSYARTDYTTDEVFANFREMKATGLKPGVLYRSTSPISFKNNKVRYTYAAELCKKNGINTIIDIADSDDKVTEFLSAEENEDSYMQECYAKGNIVGLGSNADYIDDVFLGKLARGLRAMLSKPEPYLIHCNEGKDRTGFYCLLLEALCGASLEEIKTDYMMTFINLYHQKEGTEQYELTWKKNGYRMLCHIANQDSWSSMVKIDWDKVSIEGVNLADAAEKYILRAGLSAEEIKDLKAIIGVSE